MKHHELLALKPLAVMVGRRHGVKVVFEQQIQPRTDGKTIWLPDPGLVGTEKAAKLLHGLLDHEAAHCRFTDFNAARPEHSERVLSLANILEDCSIEERLMKIYPGCRRTLGNAVEGMAEIGSFDYDENAGAVDTFEGMLLTSLRQNYLAQPIATTVDWRLKAQFQFGEELVDECLEIAEEGIKAHDSHAAIAAAQRLLERIREEQEKKEDEAKQAQKQEQQGQGQQQGTGSNPSGPGDGGGKPNTSGAPSAKEIADALKQILGSRGGKFTKGMEGMLQDAMQKEAEQHQQIPGTGSTYRGQIDGEADMTGQPFKLNDADLVPLAASTRAQLSTRLESLLESKIHEEVYYAKSGNHLDARKIAGVVLGNLKVFEHRDETIGLNTAVYMLGDVSGSTHTTLDDNVRIDKAVLVAMDAVSQCLQTWDVPTAMALFNSGYTRVKSFEQNWRNVRLIRSFGHSGTTETPVAVEEAAKELVLRPEQRKILMLCTDGDAGNWDAFENLYYGLKRIGIELKIVVIGNEKRSYERYAAFCKSTGYAPSSSELYKAIYSAMQEAF